MKREKEILLQNSNIDYIQKTLGKEPWIQVCGNKSMNDADAGFWCGFVDVDNVDTVFREISWDISSNRQSIPGFEECNSECTYYSNLLRDGLESLVIYREFYGVKPNYVELSQEFILLNNLRYDATEKSYWAMYDNGDSEKAVKYIDDTTIEIKMKFLHRYAAAKQMAILLFFDIRARFERGLKDYDVQEVNKEYKLQNLYYGFWTGNINHSSDAYSVLMGKKIIMPGPIDSCGIWPFEAKRTYDEFIIGMDEYGNEIKYSCDPDGLANYFGANPEAPTYLTPVFFKREVLQKYISKPDLYEVKEGYLSCQGLWGIEIDNHHKHCVVVYLGDLGRDLPESEQAYWKSYNIIGDETLSKESFSRDFLCAFVDSSMEDHRFQRLYVKLSEKWEEKFGWKLFLPFCEGDQYNLSQIRIPLTDSQPEFDQLVLALVKVLIDSLNEKMIQKDISQTENLKGIGKFEKWLQEKGFTDYQEHISFLRDLQELRSTGTGHRKGKSYEKISKEFSLDNKKLMDAFEAILHRANEFLEYLMTVVVG